MGADAQRLALLTPIGPTARGKRAPRCFTVQSLVRFAGVLFRGACYSERQHRSFGAAYAVGWFDDIKSVEKACDQSKGKKRIRIEGKKFRLE